MRVLEEDGVPCPICLSFRLLEPGLHCSASSPYYINLTVVSRYFNPNYSGDFYVSAWSGGLHVLLWCSFIRILLIGGR